MIISVNDFRDNINEYLDVAEYKEVLIARADGKTVAIVPTQRRGKIEKDITEETVLSAVIEVVKGYGGKDGWFDVEDLFNLHTGEVEKSHREVVAYSLCKKLVPQLTKEEFEDAHKKLLEIAAKAPKYQKRKEVLVSFNDRTFNAEITDVEWLSGRGWAYDIRPFVGGYEERFFSHIPEGNISEIAE